MKIEAVFGGILALFVLAVAAYAILTGSGRNGGGGDYGREPGSETGASGGGGGESLCGCFDDGFKLAESHVGVMSAQYRTGFEYCRARLGEPGSCAFTAGWNAALSSRPFEATCRAAIRREGC
jgi:hypothetical protein